MTNYSNWYFPHAPNPPDDGRLPINPDAWTLENLKCLAMEILMRELHISEMELKQNRLRHQMEDLLKAKLGCLPPG